MTGGASPRRKGDNFEREVKRRLERIGHFCVRQPRSKFPDLLTVLNKAESNLAVYAFAIECKMNKYISPKEREKLIELKDKYGLNPMIAYKSGKDIFVCSIDYKNNRKI